MADEQWHEVLVVQQKRFQEARQAGLTKIEARLWAESDCDTGELRKLIVKGCPPALVAKIIL